MPRTRSIADTAVLDAALELLVGEGPQGLTLAALGARVGLSASTLVQRFGSRAALLEQALARSTTHLAASPAGAGPVTRAALVDWLVAMTRGMQSRPRLAGHVALLMEDLRQAQGRRGALARTHVLELRRVLAERLQALGIADADRAARLLEAHWHGLVLQWGLGGRGSLRQWMLNGLEELLDLLGVP
ncbi:TetR/AcrR family transcriptional regulator [Stenotrophomonas sp. 24(2023)]|uniref:TetR/AcrR family transcriptional regulator n=1 Tax=Stenotrophomonas sp. 24(2023) TaxID=3068324 RepID=UPI0027DF55D2|nr:TetR/AcrR family transcriptional regulator [Stenotrophomonas sp. 24(2023)]WMJ68964.1 helix-turn-helix domain-containing protein [Stenotrophomonas sp. 24(2023)]